MKIKIPFWIALLCFSLQGFSQNNFWQEESINAIQQGNMINYDTQISRFDVYQLDVNGLKNALSHAPLRFDQSQSNVILNFPYSKGNYGQFEMFEVQTLHPELAENYTKIKSFVGRSVDKSDASTVRITLTPQGLYAMILKPNVGQVFINPLDLNGDFYMVFKKSSASSARSHSCEVDENTSFTEQVEDDDNQPFQVDDSTLRTYRLALACTGQYAQFHVNQAGVGGGTTAQQTAAVLAAMVVSIDRVNQIYERDLSVSFQLIPNNDQLIFLNSASDPYTNDDGGAMLSQNQIAIDNIIGFSNYDIGHVYSTGGGGIASLGSVCTSFKARGVTGQASPIGDPFDIDYVCHEIGHQFDANHTQNNNCQRNFATSVEPGSGSTIMGYAGICPPNVQNNSDAHFHQVSLSEMFNFITSGSGASCDTPTSIANTAPTITPVPNYTIPSGTAFYLDATATDADGDALTYNWEQINNQVSVQPPVPTSTSGPNFRSLPSTTESRRYFPNFQDVLSNNLTPQWEVIPSVARNMNFALTVRDNNVLGGQSKSETVSITVTNDGPFEVTSQNTTGIVWDAGSTETITWNVNGTDTGLVNATNVDILLSTNGGFSFDHVLASATPNDGTHDITVPFGVVGNNSRLMVRGTDNIFFAVNQEEFNVNAICENNTNGSDVSIPDGVGFFDPIAGTPAESVITLTENGLVASVSVEVSILHDNLANLEVELESPDGQIVKLVGLDICDAQGIQATFDVGGSQLPVSGCEDVITGVFQPVEDLTLFNNGNINGDWTLRVTDFLFGSTGTIDSWAIEVCKANTVSTTDFEENLFSVYPNPNNGVFNLKINNTLSGDAQLNIYNIQGRLIESQALNNSSLSQQIILKTDYQRGVYILALLSDGVKSVKKLIIR